MRLYKVLGAIPAISLLMSLANMANAETPSSNVMLVFDASGSMWGQIDGTSKIQIAREAFNNAQSVWGGPDRNVGLIAYGHRRKGDCRDIETLVPLTVGGGAQIAQQVSGLNPKGKTPLSDAIRRAADALRFREEAATVVLFSDGIETCNADPCALANELERDGIDFTAHVIGFGLGKDTDRKQLECIAENTGGRFLEARDASGLEDALTKVSAAPKPTEPEQTETAVVPLRVTIVADEGTARPDQLSVRATEVSSGETRVLGSMKGAAEVIKGLSVDLPVGAWVFDALSAEGGGSITVEVSEQSEQVHIPFKANDTGFVLQGTGPYRPGVSILVTLGVTDPLQPNAEYRVALFPAGATDYEQIMDWETRFGLDPEGYTWHDFDAPDEPGAYEIVVFKGYDLSAAEARFPFTVEADAPIRWHGAAQGEPGQRLPFVISGDAYRNNSLALRAADGTEYVNQWLQNLVSQEQGLALTLPETPGVYELFYRATTEEAETSLGKITVGDVVLEDDPDAVAPPAQVDESKLAEPKPQTQIASSGGADLPQMVFECRQPACLYFSEALGLGDIPIHQGFGVAHEARDDEGRPSFEVYNLQTGQWITVNPVFMNNTQDCFTNSENGRNPGMQQSRICLDPNSGGETVTQFESLEFWLAEYNEDTLEAELAAERAAHTATMGEDDEASSGGQIFTTSSLDRAWTLMATQTPLMLGSVAFDLSGEGEIAADVQIFPSEISGLSGSLQTRLSSNVITDSTTELLGVMGMDQGASGVMLQLNRPAGWDGKENAFEGLLIIGSTGKTIPVRMF